VSKNAHFFVSIPLNANELLLLAMGAELQVLVSFYLKISNTFSLLCSNWSQTMMERLKKK